MIPKEVERVIESEIDFELKAESPDKRFMAGMVIHGNYADFWATNIETNETVTERYDFREGRSPDNMGQIMMTSVLQKIGYIKVN